MSEPSGLVQVDLSSISKAKELSNGSNNSSKTEMIPIKISALKSYSSAEDSNEKKKEANECNANFGYDAAGDEKYGTVSGAAEQKGEKDTNDSKNDKRNGEKIQEKHTKDSQSDGTVKNGDNST
jgi:hypothetical protein